MQFTTIVFGMAALGLASQSAAADTAPAPLKDKYHVTEQERLACSADAIRLCSEAYPDEDALLSCMKANRSMLSPACVVAFDSGLRRRRL